MKQIKRNIEAATLRFRRFSRTAYAVFASLHRHVTIGTLNGKVSDAQLRKSKQENTLDLTLLCREENDNCLDNLTDESTLFGIQYLSVEAVPALSAVDVPAHAAGLTDIYDTNRISRGMFQNFGFGASPFLFRTSIKVGSINCLISDF